MNQLTRTKLSVVRLCRGTYVLPADPPSPSAWPALRVTLRGDVFIESFALSWETFATFVIDAGYFQPRFWPDERAPSGDIHARLLTLSDAEWAQSGGARGWAEPVRGLAWKEASALCAWSAARLPFEVEWRILMTFESGRFAVGESAEWMADVFDHLPVVGAEGRSKQRGPNEPMKLFAVRSALMGGGLPGSRRRGLEPDGAGVRCVARRVWDSLPTGRAGDGTVVAEVGPAPLQPSSV